MVEEKLGKEKERNKLMSMEKKLDIKDKEKEKIKIMKEKGNIEVEIMGVNMEIDRMEIGNWRIVEIFEKEIGRKLRKNMFEGKEI